MKGKRREMSCKTDESNEKCRSYCTVKTVEDGWFCGKF